MIRKFDPERFKKSIYEKTYREVKLGGRESDQTGSIPLRQAVTSYVTDGMIRSEEDYAKVYALTLQHS